MKKRIFTVLICMMIWSLNAQELLITSWTFDELEVAPETPGVIVSNSDIGEQRGTCIIYADGTNGSSLFNCTSSSSEINALDGTTLNDPRITTSAGKALVLGNSSANDKSVVFKISTTNMKNIILSFVTRGTGTGFSTHSWAYALDSVNFTALPDNNTSHSTSSWTLKTVDFSSVSAINNQSEIYIRLTVSGASGASGNNRFDNIQINGTQMSTDPPTDLPIVNVEATICENDEYEFNCITLSETGVYEYLLENPAESDTVIYLHLTVNPVYTMQITEEICAGGSYMFHGEELHDAGTYYATLQSIHGCDSIIELTLEVNSENSTTITATICEGESYLFFDEPITEAGIYSYTFQNSSGCDSTIYLHLSVIFYIGEVGPVSGEIFILEPGNYIYNINPVANATSYHWSISNQSWGLTDLDGTSVMLNIPAAGSGILSVYAMNDCYTSGIQTLTIESSVQISQHDEYYQLMIYPNPTSDNIIITSNGESLIGGKIDIYDISGRILKEVIISNDKFSISLQNFSSGVYFFKVKDSRADRGIYKVVKQ